MFGLTIDRRLQKTDLLAISFDIPITHSFSSSSSSSDCATAALKFYSIGLWIVYPAPDDVSNQRIEFQKMCVFYHSVERGGGGGG